MSEGPVDEDSESQNRTRESVRWLARAALWCGLFLFLFSFLGRHFFVAELLTNFGFHFFVLFAVGLLCARLTAASWWLNGCLVFAVCCTGWQFAKFHIPFNQPRAGDFSIRIMSFNVLGLNRDFKTVIREVRDHDPDIVAIIEYSNHWHDVFDALNDSHPHQHRQPRWHGYGIAWFSKLPIEEKSVLPLTEDEIDNPAISITVRVDGRPLKLFATHLVSPTSPKRLSLRNEQLRQLGDCIASNSVPSILVGDFNCTPSSSAFAEMIDQSNLRDARLGFGRLPTWPAWAPLLAMPIDHALVSQSIHVHEFVVGDCGGSDHRPVILDVSIGPP